LLLEAQGRGHDLYFYTADRLSMRDGHVYAPLQSLQVKDVQGEHCRLGEEKTPICLKWMWCCYGRIRPLIWPM